jgi:hypothetical protein
VYVVRMIEDCYVHVWHKYVYARVCVCVCGVCVCDESEREIEVCAQNMFGVWMSRGV